MFKIRTAKTAGAVSAALLLAVFVASAATADDLIDNNDVTVSVDITDQSPGVLALSVDADAMTLAEVESGDPLVREFTGSLPQVTVIDTRQAVPDAPWYVLGTASDFVSGDNTITAAHLGWSPALIDDYGPSVEPGGDIETVIDDPDSEGLGYADGELLFVNYDQVGTHTQGSWSATAELTLKVDVTTAVEPGNYTSVITLSLFE